MKNQIIDYLYNVYKKTNSPIIVVTVLWSISNLSAGTQEHVMAVLESNFYQISVDLLDSSNKKIKKISLDILKNCLEISTYDISIKLIAIELLEKLMFQLNLLENEAEILLKCIKIMDLIFEITILIIFKSYIMLKMFI